MSALVAYGMRFIQFSLPESMRLDMQLEFFPFWAGQLILCS